MSDEELSLRHRRASEAAAGAPSATAREAIRREAEAQAAARRAAAELPAAANESYWPMRAVAMLAVVAIAAGLWWQMRPQPATPVQQVAQTAQAELKSESLQRQDSPAPPPLAPAPAIADRPMPKATRNLQSIAPAPVAALADAAPNPFAVEIARRFPDAWSSTTPVEGLWVRVDAQGRVVDGGQQAGERKTDELKASDRTLARDAGAPAASARVAAAQVATLPAAGESVVLPNAHGVPLRISIQREPTRP